MNSTQINTLKRGVLTRFIDPKRAFWPEKANPVGSFYQLNEPPKLQLRGLKSALLLQTTVRIPVRFPTDKLPGSR